MHSNSYLKESLDMPSLRRLLQMPHPRQQESVHYSILIPILELEGVPHVIYEVRAPHMKTQPNEVCFPGGKIECGEKADAAAIRETVEELGIHESCIEMIAEIDRVVTPFNLVLHVFVAELKLSQARIQNNNIHYWDSESSTQRTLALNTDEVAEVFAVPLEWLIQHPPMVYTTTTKMTFPPDFPFHLIQNGEAYNWRTSVYPILFYENQGPTIWGITARITQNLIQHICGESQSP